MRIVPPLPSFFITLCFLPVLLKAQGTNKSVSRQRTTTVKTEQTSRPDDLKFFILTDTSYLDFVTTPGKQYRATPTYEGSMAVDAAGRLYAVMEYGEATRIETLVDGQWTPFNDGIEQPVKYLNADVNGVVYVTTNDYLYKLENDKWNKVYDGTGKKGAVPFAGGDGKLYRVSWIYENGNWVRDELVRYENGNDIPFTIPVVFASRPDYKIDRKGTVFQLFYDKNNNKTRIIEQNVEPYGTIPALSGMVEHWGFGENNVLFVGGYDGKDNYTGFLKKWDGVKWEDIPFPQFSRKRQYGSPEPQFDTKGKMYIKTTGWAGNEDATVMYRYQGDDWETVCHDNILSGITVDRFLAGGSMVYGIKSSYDDKAYRLTVHSLSNQVIVTNSRVAKLPRSFDLPPDDAYYYEHLSSYYLFQKNGKLGIQTAKGAVIAEPVFDRIRATQTPAHVLTTAADEQLSGWEKYCFEMISGRDTLYVNVRSRVMQRDELWGFKKKIASVCSVCKGKGIVPEHKETVTVRGEWVEGKETNYTQTSYDKVWDMYSRSYKLKATTRGTTTTTPGYRKPDTYKTVVIPEKKCDNCNGRSQSFAYDGYVFDSVANKYIKVWR